MVWRQPGLISQSLAVLFKGVSLCYTVLDRAVLRTSFGLLGCDPCINPYFYTTTPQYSNYTTHPITFCCFPRSWLRPFIVVETRGVVVMGAFLGAINRSQTGGPLKIIIVSWPVKSWVICIADPCFQRITVEIVCSRECCPGYEGGPIISVRWGQLARESLV